MAEQPAPDLTPEQELARLREQRAKLRGLLEHPGWIELCRVADAQARTRESQVLRVASNPATEGEQNFMKGEATGMRSLIALPQTVIDEANVQLKDSDEKESAP